MSREEYTQYMLETYPDMFGDYNKSPQETCMCWGFDIGNGWYHVLDSLCAKLDAIRDATLINVKFSQIKEKFGGACFYHYTVFPKTESEEGYLGTAKDKEDWKKYIDTWDDIISDLIDSYESYCNHIDDITGRNCDPKDKIIIGGWYYGHTKESRLNEIKNSEMSEDEKNQHLERLSLAMTRKEFNESNGY